MNRTKLYLFTSDFPYGTGETFLESEIIYLAKGFDEVKIISQNTTSDQCRSIPENCTVERINLLVSSIGKIKALFGIFNPLFWQERKIIKTIYGKKITKGIVSTMLISLVRANKVKKRVALFQEANQSLEKQYFYSYWCDDVALGLAMAKVENSNSVCFSRIHGWDVYFEASVLNYLPYRHFISKKLNAIFAVSQKGIDYAFNKWYLTKNNVFHLARLGVEKQCDSANEAANFILVSCSNVIPLKRVDLIVHALAEMKESNITWVHFGDGPQMELVKELAKDKLPENVSFDFKGRVSNQEILEWYAQHNPSVFINVSTTEGIPVSIMEAMSFGIPVIATNVGGTAEIVDDENGFLISQNPTLVEIKIAIEEALGNSQKSLAAYSTWNDKFNAAKNYSHFVKMIQSF